MSDRIFPCPEWAERLVAHPDDLSAAEQAALAEHLATCDNCPRVRAQYEQIAASLRRFPALQTPSELPPRLQQFLGLPAEADQPMPVEQPPAPAPRLWRVYPPPANAPSIVSGMQTGHQLGEYDLFAVIGSSASAEIYLGRHIALQTQAAIKVWRAPLLAESQRARFTEQAETLKRLTHPYLARVLDFGLVHHVPYLIMDYAPGGSVRQRIAKGARLDQRTIAHYTRQTADALAYLHAQGMIHRNLKPENLLLGADERILLSDVALEAQVYPLRVDSLQTQMHYISPEQLGKRAQPASDQYALAVIVYEWLAGEVPFRGTVPELAMHHLLLPPPPLDTGFPPVSTQVEQVVFRALAKNPTERFTNVSAFARALEAAILHNTEQGSRLHPRWPDDQDD